MALCLKELLEFNGGFGQGDSIKKGVNLISVHFWI